MGTAALRSATADQRLRLCRPDYKIVQVAAHFEPGRLVEPPDLHRLETGRSDQPLNILPGAVVIRYVEENRQLR